MYGSHYSTAGYVLGYLLRLEPFTTMALELQEGHFDCADRLFFDVAESWKGCTTSISDVRELTPEWYYLPEMFKNSNKWDLGELQENRGTVNNVRLPPWAKGR